MSDVPDRAQPGAATTGGQTRPAVIVLSKEEAFVSHVREALPAERYSLNTSREVETATVIAATHSPSAVILDGASSLPLGRAEREILKQSFGGFIIACMAAGAEGARAEDAIRDLDGSDFGGRALKVNEARPRR